MAKLDAGTIQMKRTRINVGELIERATRDLLIPMELREQKLIVSCEKETGFLGDLSKLTSYVTPFALLSAFGNY